MATVITDRLPLSARASEVDAGDDEMTITLLLRPREDLPSPAALSAGGWAQLDHDALERAHGARPEDLTTLEAFFHARGLTPAEPDWKVRAARRGSVHVSGLRSAVSAAFGVVLARYALGRDQFITHTQNVSIGSDLAEIIQAILGLDTRPAVQRTRFFRGNKALAVGALPETTYSAREVAALYDYPAVQGEGQCIGLIEMSGVLRREDAAVYFEHFGVRPDIVAIDLRTPVPSGWDVEVTLDAEIAGLACPGCKLAIYNAASRDFSMRDFYAVIEAAVFDEVNRPSVLSISWAFAEEIEGLDADVEIPSSVGPALEAPFRALFTRAALLGITLCAASGDLGSQIAATSQGVPTAIPTSMFPSTSPLVLGIGGTTILVRGGRIVEERVWNRLREVLVWVAPEASLAGGGGASGGGVSAIHRLPPYQEGFDVPEAVVLSWEDGVLTERKRWRGRGVPDVAANSDFQTGYQFFFSGQWGVCGGTSSATPMWAALLARINEALGRRVGFIGPLLYAIQRASGDAARTISRGGNGGYFASEDLWNPCTGLGAPDGERLLEALRRHQAP